MTRLQRMIQIVSDLSAMQSKLLWKNWRDEPTNFDLLEHWRKKEVAIRILISKEYEKKV